MTNENVAVLLLRDGEGNVYLLGEDKIRSCKATPEQQEKIAQALSDQDVSGFVGAGGFSAVGPINIVVAPQINVATGLNLAVLSPGAQQVLGQAQGNQLFALS
jgi:hypothetical protein